MAHTYYPATIVITFSSAAYTTGDYGRLFGDTNSDAIDFASATSDVWDNKRYVLSDTVAGATVTMTAASQTVGMHIFGVETYDSLGNAHGSLVTDEDTIYIDMKPRIPGGMGITSYDPESQDLVLTL